MPERPTTPEPFALTDDGYVLLSGRAEIDRDIRIFGRVLRRKPRVMLPGDVHDPGRATEARVSDSDGIRTVRLEPDVASTAGRLGISSIRIGTGLLAVMTVGLMGSSLFFSMASRIYSETGSSMYRIDVDAFGQEVRRRAEAGETGFSKRELGDDKAKAVSPILKEMLARTRTIGSEETAR